MENLAEKQARAIQIISLLEKATVEMVPAASGQVVKKYGRNPFLVLISCLLSLRTKDSVSLPASLRLFEYAHAPQTLLLLPIQQIEQLIYPVGFYRKKAQLLHKVCHELIERFDGCVPSTEEELLSLPGVGRKTMNLVLGEGFGIPAICVDTHVHRIANRLGLVETKKPEDTEFALKQVIPRNVWIRFNHLLVQWGQNICVPISPKCSACVLSPVCPKKGVTIHR